MFRSTLAASLLQSGYNVVDQTMDRPALPKNYRAQVPKLYSNVHSRSVPTTTNVASSPYVKVGSCTFYSGGDQMMTHLRVFFLDTNLYDLCGMQIGYPNNVWTEVMGKKTSNVQNWNREDGEKVTQVYMKSLSDDGRVSTITMNSSTRGGTSFGICGNAIVTDYHDANLPPLYDFQTYYTSDCIIWIQYVGKYNKADYGGKNNGGGGGSSDGDLTLVPRPRAMLMSTDLAREFTSDITTSKWQKFFKAKFLLGSDVSDTLGFLVDNDEEKAWSKYYDNDKKQLVYICDSDGEIYIWTRDIGTADAPEHVTQIGYCSQDSGLLVSMEWSLTGTFSKNDIEATTLAYKSWFTKYVKDSTGEVIKEVADQVLRDALCSAGVITEKGVLTVKYGGAPSATGANVINSFIIGTWAMLACEKFVKEVVPEDYLVVDTLSFDQQSDWVQIAAEGDDDAILGASSGTVAIPKTDNYVYPGDYEPSSSTDITIFMTTNIFLEKCTTRRAWASVNQNNKLVDVFGYVATADNVNNTASVGITVLPTDEQGAQSQLKKLKARSGAGSTSSPPTIIAAHKTGKGDPLQKISVLIGKYA